MSLTGRQARPLAGHSLQLEFAIAGRVLAEQGTAATASTSTFLPRLALTHGGLVQLAPQTIAHHDPFVLMQ
jgi:hypothetical protein